MEELLSSVTPVRSNLAQMLLTLKDLPPDVSHCSHRHLNIKNSHQPFMTPHQAVAESLNRLVSSLKNTPNAMTPHSSARLDDDRSEEVGNTDSSLEIRNHPIHKYKYVRFTGSRRGRRRCPTWKCVTSARYWCPRAPF